MLNSPFQTERAVNIRFFTDVFSKSGFETICSLPLFCMGGKRQIFFCCFASLQGGGRGTETKRWQSPVFLLFIEARTCDRWGHPQSPSSLAEHSPAQSCFVWAQLWESKWLLREQVLTSLVLACLTYLFER